MISSLQHAPPLAPSVGGADGVSLSEVSSGRQRAVQRTRRQVQLTRVLIVHAPTPKVSANLPALSRLNRSRVTLLPSSMLPVEPCPAFSPAHYPECSAI